MLGNRGRDILDRLVAAHERRTTELRASLRALSPLGTLSRGYDIAHIADGVIVRDAAQAPAGTALTTTVARAPLPAPSWGRITQRGAPCAGAPPPHDDITPR